MDLKTALKILKITEEEFRTQAEITGEEWQAILRGTAPIALQRWFLASKGEIIARAKAKEEQMEVEAAEAREKQLEEEVEEARRKQMAKRAPRPRSTFPGPF